MPNSFARPFSAPGFSILIATTLFLGANHPAQSGPLEDYVRRPDPSFSWTRTGTFETNGFSVSRVELVSQTWRNLIWNHHLIVVRPPAVRNPDIAFLFITGNGRGDDLLKVLELLAQRAGAVTAVITQVPNEPLFDGKSEDALIAYTFDQYIKTGDQTWPLLFPMAKSAVRGLEAVQAFAQKQYGQKVERFVVGGASKRGWTTWLAGAVDRRIVGIAPMVIDMLNMAVQTDWQQQVYGRSSEEVGDYTKAGIIARIHEPPMARLRQWVDPYSYRNRYTMAKLLLLGTNDPYWTVDSLRHYWNDLPEPKLIFQTPNAGHDLAGGEQAMPTLAAFFEMIADRKPLPRMTWTIDYGKTGSATIQAKLNQPVQSARFWTATSTNRDFRGEQWLSHEVKVNDAGAPVTVSIDPPRAGYAAFLVEAALVSPSGAPYRLSTGARVNPDTSPWPEPP